MSADSFFADYGFVLIVLLLGVATLIAALVRAKRSVAASEDRRSLWDYLLLWPLVLDQPARRERVARGGRFLTRGEILGALALLILIVLAVTFGW